MQFSLLSLAKLAYNKTSNYKEDTLMAVFIIANGRVYGYSKNLAKAAATRFLDAGYEVQYVARG